MGFRIESLVYDVRYAARRLARAPMFTCVAVIVLALGVGVNTAFFSLVNGVLLRPLNVPGFGRLVNIASTRNGEVNLNSGLDERRLRHLKERRPASVEKLLTVQNFQAAIESSGPAALVMGEAVSGDYFAVLGIRAAAGRLLSAADDGDGAGGPVVLSARLWRRDFGADPAVIGREVRVSGLPLVVVGVAPDTFTGLTAPNILSADFWVPQNSVRPLIESPGLRGGLVFRAFAQLTNGATLSGANAELRTLGAGIDPNDRELGLAVVSAGKGLLPPQLATVQAVLGVVLLALSCVVLFVACANLSGLVMARASRRSTEIAVRLAIGAERQRILQMQMVETALLSAMSGIAGLGMAWVATRIFSRLPIPEIGGMVMRLDAAPDLRVFGFALVAAAATTMLVGWVPAARMAATDPLHAWSACGVGSVTPRLRNATSRLVAFQVGASLSLLLVASLFVRSATSAATFDTAVDLSRVVAGRINLRLQKISDSDGPAVLERLTAVAHRGDARLALASGVPIGGDGRQEALRVYGHAASYATHAIIASPSLFEIFDIRLVKGRSFDSRDGAGQLGVVVVNEIVAADLWPGSDAIGKSFRVSSMRDSPVVTVIGVVRETDRTLRGTNDRRYIFLPLAQNYTTQMALLLSGTGDATSMMAALRTVVASAAPGVAVFDVKPLPAFIGLGAAGTGFAAVTIGAIGVLGFFIAMVGLYGTMAYVVGERTREFGIMRAFGADGWHIRRLVLRDAIRMLALGMAPGLVLTFLLAGLLQSWLLGLPAHDPVTFIVVPFALFLVGCGAALVPAHRASKSDPTSAIRHL